MIFTTSAVAAAAILGAAAGAAAARGLRFSYCVTSGNEPDLGLADYLNFVLDDPETSQIVLFVEGIRRPEAFSASHHKRRRTASGWRARRSWRRMTPVEPSGRSLNHLIRASISARGQTSGRLIWRKKTAFSLPEGRSTAIEATLTGCW